MNVKIWYNFSKRANSTLRPSTTSGGQIGNFTIDAHLLENTSYYNPSFIIQRRLLGTVPKDISGALQYVEITIHKNAYVDKTLYYYITNVVNINNNHLQIDCELDPMATEKDIIGNTTAFIERCSTGYDDYKIDPFVNSSVDFVSHFSSLFEHVFTANGCYAVTVANDTAGSATGGTGLATYIVKPGTGLSSLRNIIYDISGMDAEGESASAAASKKLIAQFGDCFSCIKSVKYIPLTWNDLTNSAEEVEQIRIGNYTLPNSYGYSLQSREPLRKVANFDISDLMPDDFRRSEPYTSARIFIPFYGNLELQASKLTNNIIAQFDIDKITGEVFFQLFNSTPGLGDMEYVAASVCYNCAIDVPVSQIGAGKWQNVLSAATGVARSALTLDVGGTIDSGSKLMSAVASSGIHTTGNLGGNSMCRETDCYLTITTMKDNGLSNASILGRPYGGFKQISTSGGYVKCNNASIKTELPMQYKNIINGYLNSGFYYE